MNEKNFRLKVKVITFNPQIIYKTHLILGHNWLKKPSGHLEKYVKTVSDRFFSLPKNSPW